MAKQVVATGFIIFRRVEQQIQYLLLHASYELNLWSPPKGHVDPGESEFEAAVRETKEEAGLDQKDLKIMEGFESVLNYEVRGRPKRVVYWLAELRDVNQKVQISDEHRDYNWFNLSKAKETVKFPDMRATLDAADAFITGRQSS